MPLCRSNWAIADGLLGTNCRGKPVSHRARCFLAYLRSVIDEFSEHPGQRTISIPCVSNSAKQSPRRRQRSNKLRFLMTANTRQHVIRCGSQVTCSSVAESTYSRSEAKITPTSPYRGCTGSSFDLAFSHSSCVRAAAWIYLAYWWTKRGDVGTTSPTILTRQKTLSKQSKYRFVSLEHRHHFTAL